MPTTKRTVARKTTTAKSAPAPAPEAVGDAVGVFAAEFIELVTSGAFDGHLDSIDEAVTERISKYNDEKAAEEKKSAKSTTTATTRTVPQPTRKTPAAKFDADVNGTYVISGGNKTLEGKKVKFLRFRKDDDAKAVVEMLEDAPGAPKGKKMVVPVAALKKSAAAGRRAVVKKTAKKTTAKK